MSPGSKMTVAGVMSGTSLDGVDIAITELSEDHNGQFHTELKHFTTVPYPEKLRGKMEQVVQPEITKTEEISVMNMLLGEFFADAVIRAISEAKMNKSDVQLISTHGQTIYHDPSKIKKDVLFRPNTLQIGDISVIAERTGITTIGDFRTRDMAVGGQGAPLVPFADYHLFRSDQAGRILVNIGGISNITVLPMGCSEDDVLAYDTGPGNMIIDAFMERITDGQESYDKDGRYASKGNIHEGWLHQLLSHTYYSQKPPKSTGREQFGRHYVETLWSEADQLNLRYEDRAATVTKLTAITLATELKRHIQELNIREIIISGGGWHNKTLIQWIQQEIGDEISINSSAHYGIPGDAKEAIVFAILGYLGMQKRPNNLPAATGARKKVVMGKIAW